MEFIERFQPNHRAGVSSPDVSQPAAGRSVERACRQVCCALGSACPDHQGARTDALPWLAQHPVSGWLLYDPAGSTGRAYGLEIPNTVYVGTDRKIMAFSHGFVPRDVE